MVTLALTMIIILIITTNNDSYSSTNRKDSNMISTDRQKVQRRSSVFSGNSQFWLCVKSHKARDPPKG